MPTYTVRFKDEIVPVEVPQSKKDPLVFDRDEHFRPGLTLDQLQKLPPAFVPKTGKVTAGNASGINDGAAAVMVMSADKATELGLKPLARIVAFSSAGVDPAIMGTGPIPATQKCLDKAGWSVADLDLVEANEAFAAQAMSVNKELGWDTAKVNVSGGAISIGHPIGASGARVLVTGGSSGIGLAIATAFVDAGGHVTITGTRPTAADYEADLSRFDYRQLHLQSNEEIRAVALSVRVAALATLAELPFALAVAWVLDVVAGISGLIGGIPLLVLALVGSGVTSIGTVCDNYNQHARDLDE